MDLNPTQAMIYNDRLDAALKAATDEARAAIPNGSVKLDGRWRVAARIPHLTLTDQFGNVYEGLVLMPEVNV